MTKKVLLAISLSVIFFLAEFLTLGDYGTSWDETLHLSRGQAYLNFFLTGKKSYDQSNQKKSFYQLDYQNGDYWFKENGGHPPINGILAAVSNLIFYQKLGLLNDIHSYQLFNILISTFLVFIVTFLTAESISLFAALVSFLVLFLYPLFFAEAHFNIKDPAETAFFTATIWSFIQSINKKSAKWLIASTIFFALGLGTKFNILFLPLVIVPYLLLRFKNKLNDLTIYVQKIPKSYLFSLIVSPIIIAGIFFGSWPYLWNNWPSNLLNVFSYYKEIGTGTTYQPEIFFIFGFNLFPALWILFTTPPIVLTLTLVGIIACLKDIKYKSYLPVLLLLWFFIPILRVSLPGTTIYGGIRQVLEFLPAMAIIAGLGADYLFKLLKLPKLLILTVVTILVLLPFRQYHPNENVYFNSLIGGLQGAKEKNFPSWGNSYGNAYFQGIQWLNANAPFGSKVALIQGTETNAPIILFRKDIQLRNAYWSGLERNGEYLMDLTFNDTGRAFYYTWEYVDKFLEPAYELKVDNVAILKIWKNDTAYFKEEYKNLRDVLYTGDFKITKTDNKLILDFEKEVNLSRVVLDFESADNCLPITTALVESSKDQQTWMKEGDSMPFTQLHNKSNLEDNRLTVYFADRRAKNVRFLFESAKSCGLIDTQAEVFIF